MSHKFLMYEDEDGEVWVLSKNETNCDCCTKSLNDYTTGPPNRPRMIDKPPNRPESLPLRPKKDQIPVVAYKPKTYPQGMQIFAPTPPRSTDSSTLSIDKMRSANGVTRIEVPDEVELRIPKKPARGYQKTAQGLNVITTQPGKVVKSDPVKLKEKKKHRNCCKACYVECGRFCVELVRNL